MSGPRLNSWKEIATHLGKSVRTVQRWEQVYGLPVHRMGQEGGEIVWADVVEVDAWVKAQSKRSTAAPVDPIIELPAPEVAVEVIPLPSAVSPIAASPKRRWSTASVVTLTVVTVTAAAAFVVWGLAPGDAVDWRASERQLVGIAANGQAVWTYEFPAALDPGSFGHTVAGKPGSALIRRDLDGDGRLETLVAFRTGERPSDSAFHVIGPDGRPRFAAVRPTHTVTFGAAVYHGPWTAHRVFVTTTDNGDVRIHVSFIHLNEFPTVLLTLDRDGRVLSEYWSNGYIETVNTGTKEGKRIWMVGATNNDTKGASLALFDAEPRGSAPARQDAYVCRGCVAGSPSAFLVLPRLCMAPAWTVSGQATTSEAYTDASGAIFAHVREGPTSKEGVPLSEVIYQFDATLRPLSALVTVGLLTTHRDLERQGLLKHSWSPGEELTLFPALKWDGTRFIELPRARVTY